MTDQSPLSVNRLTWRVMRKRTGIFVGGGAGWDIYFIGALGLGLLLELIFDGIVDDRSATYLTVTIAAYAGVELARRLVGDVDDAEKAQRLRTYRMVVR